MKQARRQAPRPQWTREQMNAADWTPEQLAEARKRWDLNRAGPEEPKREV